MRLPRRSQTGSESGQSSPRAVSEDSRPCLSVTHPPGARNVFEAESFDARDGVKLIPAILAVRDVGSGDADAIANLGNGDPRSKSRARSRGIGPGSGVLADDLDDEMSPAVRHVHQIQDRFPVGVERDMQIAIRSTAQRDDAAIDGRAGFDDSQPSRPIHVSPEMAVAIRSRQPHRRLPRVPQPGHQEQRDGKAGQRDQKTKAQPSHRAARNPPTPDVSKLSDPRNSPRVHIFTDLPPLSVTGNQVIHDFRTDPFLTLSLL